MAEVRGIFLFFFIFLFSDNVGKRTNSDGEDVQPQDLLMIGTRKAQRGERQGSLGDPQLIYIYLPSV